jgi:hypothetical protein
MEVIYLMLAMTVHYTFLPCVTLPVLSVSKGVPCGKLAFNAFKGTVLFP